VGWGGGTCDGYWVGIHIEKCIGDIWQTTLDGTFADTANVDYLLSLNIYAAVSNRKRKTKAKRFSLICLPFAHRTNGSLLFVRLFAKKQTEVIRSQTEVIRSQTEVIRLQTEINRLQTDLTN
jgi:hypothetical protein